MVYLSHYLTNTPTRLLEISDDPKKILTLLLYATFSAHNLFFSQSDIFKNKKKAKKRTTRYTKKKKKDFQQILATKKKKKKKKINK